MKKKFEKSLINKIEKKKDWKKFDYQDWKKKVWKKFDYEIEIEVSLRSEKVIT